MKFLSAIIFLLITTFSFSQCLTDHYNQEQLKKYPQYQKSFDDMNKPMYPVLGKTSGVIRIIPVVVHVIYNGGDENISKAQIEDAIKVLNEDYRRKNSDTVNTKAIFKSVAVDCEIEFRLAKLDPNGNCTDGIDRVESKLTENAEDDVKDLSYWDSHKYLNIWVVKTIRNNTSINGIILGYAQFPGQNPSTDGVVIRADCMGRIGIGRKDYNGRTLTHEVGHCLNLLHTFQGGCSGGGDQVFDTPPTANPNYGCPLLNSCHNDNPDVVDQNENYMDYSNGSCENMFSAGQRIRMDNCLAGTRAQLVSAANNIATGVNLTGTQTCKPMAGFFTSLPEICTDDSVDFFDASYNGIPVAWTWTFEGGNPMISTDTNPKKIVFANPGVYKIKQVVMNSAGSDSITKINYLSVKPAIADLKGPFMEGFQSTPFSNAGWSYVFRDINRWRQSNTIGHSGNKCMYVNYYSSTDSFDRDAMVSPYIDISKMQAPVFSFYTAYKAPTDIFQGDILKIYISNDCNKNWTNRWTKTGKTLSGNLILNTSYTAPIASDWHLQTLDLSYYKGSTKLRLMIETTSKQGNYMYIDDINIFDSQNNGIDNQENASAFIIFPNPSNDYFILRSGVTTKNESAEVYDMTGRILVRQNLSSIGETKFDVSTLAGGIYFVRVGTRLQKIVVE